MRLQTHVHSATTDRAGKPAGYCPHCDYAIDPGVCPECGHDVAPARLAAIPAARRLRRRVWKATKLCAAIALFLGARHVYRSGLWTLGIPTSALLWLDIDSIHANDELVIRLGRDELSAAELDELLDRTISITTSVRSPQPVSDTIEFKVLFNTTGSVGYVGYCTRRLDLTIDGVAIDELRDQIHSTRPSFRFRLDRHLSVGTHILEGTAIVSITYGTSRNRRIEAGPISIPIRVHHEIVVDDRPAEAYVAPRTDPLSVANAQYACGLSLCGNGDCPATIQFCTQPTTANIAGVIEARLSGHADVLASCEVLHVRCDYRLKPNVLTLPESVSVDNARIDVRFTPDAQLAFDAGMREYVPCVMEWYDLPLAELRRISNSGAGPCCVPGASRAPDHVAPWGDGDRR